MVLRSDEQANLAEIERDEKFRGNIGKAIGTGVSLVTASAGGHFASKVMPFLSKYIPAGLALKGINKVNPKLGAFLSKGQEMGLDLQEGLDFVKEKFESKKQPAKESRNIIEQYSPELHQFIDQEVKSGRPALHAGAIAQNDKRFKKIIEKITKDHKSNWSDILQSIYGNGEMAQQNMPQPADQMEQQQIQQPGKGSQARDQLLQAMQALSQNLKG